MPEYEGDDIALLRFIGEHTMYPDKLRTKIFLEE